jgi:Cu2+-exporting ATPase
MKHSYQITGMSCNGCRSSVEKAINTIDGVDAIVTLHPPVATITMEKHVPTEQLQEALNVAGNYTISMGNPTENATTTDANPGKKSCC